MQSWRYPSRNSLFLSCKKNVFKVETDQRQLEALFKHLERWELKLGRNNEHDTWVQALFEVSRECHFRCLDQLNIATGKFPYSALRLVRWPFGKEITPVFTDYCHRSL